MLNRKTGPANMHHFDSNKQMVADDENIPTRHLCAVFKVSDGSLVRWHNVISSNSAAGGCLCVSGDCICSLWSFDLQG